VCGPTEICDGAGQCAEGGSGDDCTSPFIVSGAPFTGEGSTDDANLSLFYGDDMCFGDDTGNGEASADEVWAFNPPEAALYTVSLTGFDAALYVVTDCDNIAGTCEGASETALSDGVETVTFYGLTEQTYYIIVDGWSNSSNVTGDYTLEISAPCFPDCEGKECGPGGCDSWCGVCEEGDACDDGGQCVPLADLPGNTCANPFVIDELPAEVAGDTENATPVLHYGDDMCPGDDTGNGQGAADEVWMFTAPDTAIYLVTVSGYDAALYVVTDCDNIATSCLGASESEGASGTEEVVFEGTEGEDYFIIVDGWSNSSNGTGAYTLTVSGPCVGDCEGKTCGSDGCGATCGECGEAELCNGEGQCVSPDTVEGNACGNPFFIDEAPVTVEGDTSDASPALFYGDDACPGDSSGNGESSNDEVWEFVAPVEGTYTAYLSGFDTALYVVSDCDKIDLTCLGASETEMSDGTEEVSFPATAGESYFIIVDGWSNSSNVAGEYTLEISEPCLPSCDNKECGDDGCGVGNCGLCADGFLCDADGQCEDVSALEGNSCPNPFMINGAGTYTGDTSVAGTTNNYASESNGCEDMSGVKGSASNDHAYKFVPAAAGSFTITLTGDFDGALYVVTDCSQLGDSCLIGDDGFSSDQVQLPLEEGVEYYVIVDGWSNSDNLNGAYELVVEKCIPDCEGKVCGSDECGGSCGECGEGKACDDDGQCIVATCEGACGSVAEAGCWCDSTCFDFGDCCDDVCSFCAADFPEDCLQ